MLKNHKYKIVTGVNVASNLRKATEEDNIQTSKTIYCYLLYFSRRKWICKETKWTL